MFRQVLVPVSFSARDRQLARHACNAARAIGGSVTLLHVLESSAPESSVQGGALRAAQTLLEQLSLLARRPPGCLIVPAASTVPGASTLPEEGVASVILSVAAQIGADLIMLGLQVQELSPPGGTEQAVFPQLNQSQLNQGQVNRGRVIWQVLLGARVPVQVVPCPQGEPPAHGWRGALAAPLRTAAGP